MVRFSLNIKTCCLHVTWEIQDQIWAKIFCIPKKMNSRTPMGAESENITPATSARRQTCWPRCCQLVYIYQIWKIWYIFKVLGI